MKGEQMEYKRRSDEDMTFKNITACLNAESQKPLKSPLPANIYLTGFMGAGKTSAGRLLAATLGAKFYDTDELIRKSLGMSVEEIFRSRGEVFFRDRETELLRVLGKKTLGTCVIATGGGVVLREENIKAMRQNGLIVLLEVTADEAYRRLKGSGSRPLLKGGNPKVSIEDLLQKRRPFYQEADLTVETTGISLEETVKKIMAAIQKG